jgi:hypothetical protein
MYATKIYICIPVDWRVELNWEVTLSYSHILILKKCIVYIVFKPSFLRGNVFKIVPVQVLTKLEMSQNYVTFIFVVTYVLQTMWPCVVHILIIDHRPLLSIRSRMFALLRHRAGDGASGVSIRALAEQRISRSSVTERDRHVIVIRTCRTCWVSKVAWAQINKSL